MRITNSPFKTYSLSKITAALILDQETYEHIVQNRSLYDGDHWLEGDGWVGPLPAATEALKNDLKEELRRVFCSRNVVREVVDRKVDGLLKSRPQLSAGIKQKPKKGEEIPEVVQAQIDEFNSLFQSWFKNHQVMKTLKEVYGRSLLGERVTVRLYVPKGLLVQNSRGRAQMPPIANIEDALDYIHVTVHVGDEAGAIVDKDTQLKAHACDIRLEDSRYTEMVYIEGDDTIIQSVATDEEDLKNETGVVTPDESLPRKKPPRQWKLKLGGRSTMYQPRIRPIITQQVRENQFAINLAKTMQNRNTITGGFLERIILDAMPPGKWIPDPADPDNNEIYEIGPMKLGAGTTNFFMAGQYRDKDTGEMKLGKPDVIYREPVSASTFIDSKRDCYQDILEEVGQPHILTTSGSRESGKSREQAKETYRGTLEDDEAEINDMLNWMQETVMAMGAFFSKQADKYKLLSAESKCYINIGPLTGNERQDNREDVKAGQLSIRTSMMRSGVENPQAEFDRIQEEAGITDEAVRNKVDMAEKLVKMGFEEDGVVEAVGLPEERRKHLKLKPKEEIVPPKGVPKVPPGQANNPRGIARSGAPMN